MWRIERADQASLGGREYRDLSTVPHEPRRGSLDLDLIRDLQKPPLAVLIANNSVIRTRFHVQPFSGAERLRSAAAFTSCSVRHRGVVGMRGPQHCFGPSPNTQLH
jgi:hypothetical protein